MMNGFQRTVSGWLDEWGLQWTEEYPVGQYSIDLYIPELALAVEVDGPSHGLRRKKDRERDDRLASLNIGTVRIPVGAKKEHVKTAILARP